MEKDGLERTRAFIKVGDPEIRRSVIELVRSLGRCNGKN